MRAPIDVMQIAQLIGLSQDFARKSIREHCQNVLKHAHCRKTYKGAAEIIQQAEVSSESDKEDEEMD